MTPKYEIGQDVYLLRDNKICTDQVVGIILMNETLPKYRYFDAGLETKYDPGATVIKYTFDFKRDGLCYRSFFDESQLFLTKEDLIKSLL